MPRFLLHMVHQHLDFRLAELDSRLEEAGISPAGAYDRVLCDVPCSGDGTLRKSPDLWRRWASQLLRRLEVVVRSRHSRAEGEDSGAKVQKYVEECKAYVVVLAVLSEGHATVKRVRCLIPLHRLPLWTVTGQRRRQAASVVGEERRRSK